MDGLRPLAALVLALVALPASAHAAYAPHLSASIDPTTPGKPVALTTTVTQAAGETASRTVKVQLPVGFTPNLGSTIKACPAAALQQRACPTDSLLGTASATTPFGPFAGTVNFNGLGTGGFQLVVLLSGKVLGLLPVNQTLNGTVTPTAAGFLTTFDNLPSILTTTLTLRLDGPPRTLLVTPTTCGPRTITGDFTSQNGEHATSSAVVTISGCPPPVPSISRVRMTPRHPRHGQTLRVSYRLSAAAELTVRLRQLAPRRRVVSMRTISVPAGSGSLKLRGPRSGRYRVELSARGASTRRLTFRVR
jgi:hypothetical protein